MGGKKIPDFEPANLIAKASVNCCRSQIIYTELEIITGVMRLQSNGGADGTRTRDPRRDRPVF